MVVPDDPGAAAAEASRQAGERIESARESLLGLHARTTVGGVAEEVRFDRPGLDDARSRELTARVRLRIALFRAAVAHERAAQAHEDYAQHGLLGAAEHRRLAEWHCAGARADRLRAAGVDLPDREDGVAPTDSAGPFIP